MTSGPPDQAVVAWCTIDAIGPGARSSKGLSPGRKGRVAPPAFWMSRDTEDGMAKKQGTRQPPATPEPAERPGVTAERFSRLFKLVQFLGGGPQTRDRLTRHLDLDVRGFYRDL